MEGCPALVARRPVNCLFADSIPSLMPPPFESWVWGMSVRGSFRRVLGWTRPQEMQLISCLLIQPGGLDAVAVLLVEDHGAHQVRLSRAPIWCPSGGGGTREAGGIVAD